MKNRFLFAVIVWLGVISQSCKKEHEPPVNQDEAVNTCKEYDFGSCAWGPGFRPTGPEYTSPCFNPNNPKEFLYVKKVGSHRSIHKYNLLTKQNTLILENLSAVQPPDWSRIGWIVFTDMSWKVWKVRDDGTGLKRISNGKNDQYPAFNPAGDKIIFARSMEFTIAQLEQNPNLNNLYKMQIIDLDGHPVDSICSVRFGYCSAWGISSWVEPDRILRVTSTNQKNEVELSYYNYKTRQDEPALSTFNDEGKYGWEATDYKVMDNSRIYYSVYYNGFYMFDVTTKRHRLLRNNCTDQNYGAFSISPDKTRLLVEKEVNTQISNCLFDQKKTIVLMNLDGSGEKEIKLP